MATKAGAEVRNNDDPEVPAYVERHERQWLLYIQCPLCGDLHSHGGGMADRAPSYGHRVSHCITEDSGGYWLVPGDPLMPKPKALPRRERFRALLAYDRRRGQQRGQVTPKAERTPVTSQPRRKRGGINVLTDEQVRDMRARYAAGAVTQGRLAAELGVSRATVSNVLLGKLGYASGLTTAEGT